MNARSVRRVDGALALGDEHRRQVERRRSAAVRLVGPAGAAAARIAAAPAAYLLTQNSSDVARQSQLLSTLPAHGEARVVVTPGRSPSEWHLDVASRDRPGLLAGFTGVLADRGVDVAQAVLATWDDGGALEAFLIRAPAPPEPRALQHALEASLDEPLWSPPIADAAVTFRRGSALYTCCDVRAPDRPGLLHAVAVAIASAGADVHAACVATVDGIARDCFDLSDRAGHPLDTTLEQAVRDGVRRGVAGRRPGRSRMLARD